MKAEKFIEEKEENDYITRKYHIIKEVDLPEDELLELCEEYDDYEQAYDYGISVYVNGDIFCIEVNNFIEGLEDEELEENDFKKSMIKKLEKYRGYTIYFWGKNEINN